MPLARYLVLAQKSIAASLAAIEIYNKPNFSYREETFSILMINAWELLLKARIVQKTGGNGRGIHVWESTWKKDGTKGKLMRLKRNRSGQPLTIGLARAAETVRGFGNEGIDQHCVANIRLLQSIRDNAIHLYNIDHALAYRIYQVGSAALKNFVAAYEEWFGFRLDRYNLFLLPLAFQPPSEAVSSLRRERRTDAVQQLLSEIEEAEKLHPPTPSGRFDVTIQVELRFVRSKDSKAIPVRRHPGDGSAVNVVWTEEQIREKYPWNYAELTTRLKSRYTDLVQNQKYYRIKRGLETDDSLCHVRYLDPEKKASGSKKFYSTSIIQHFDPHYTQKP